MLSNLEIERIHQVMNPHGEVRLVELANDACSAVDKVLASRLPNSSEELTPGEGNGICIEINIDPVSSKGVYLVATVNEIIKNRIVEKYNTAEYAERNFQDDMDYQDQIDELRDRLDLCERALKLALDVIERERY